MHFIEKLGVSVRRADDQLNLIHTCNKSSLNTAFPQITACWNLYIWYIFMAFFLFQINVSLFVQQKQNVDRIIISAL